MYLIERGINNVDFDFFFFGKMRSILNLNCSMTSPITWSSASDDYHPNKNILIPASILIPSLAVKMTIVIKKNYKCEWTKRSPTTPVLFYRVAMKNRPTEDAELITTNRTMKTLLPITPTLLRNQRDRDPVASTLDLEKST